MVWLVRAVRRQLSVPAPWILAAVSAFTTGATVAAVGAISGAISGATALVLLPIIAGLVGTVAVGADFRYGSLPNEILLQRRLGYLARTNVASSIVAAAIGLISALTAVAVATLVLAPAARFVAPANLAAVSILVAVCWAILGSSLVVISASQSAAVAALVAYVIAIEPLLAATSAGVAAALPGQLRAVLLAAPADVAVAGPAVSLLVVACGAWFLAGVVMFRRDVPVA